MSLLAREAANEVTGVLAIAAGLVDVGGAHLQCKTEA